MQKNRAKEREMMLAMFVKDSQLSGSVSNKEDAKYYNNDNNSDFDRAESLHNS